MNMYGNPFASYGGFKLIESDRMVVGPFEDWSQVRSPGRARRRRAKHPQRIRVYYKPDTTVMQDKVRGIIYGHPATLNELRKML